MMVTNQIKILCITALALVGIRTSAMGLQAEAEKFALSLLTKVDVVDPQDSFIMFEKLGYVRGDSLEHLTWAAQHGKCKIVEHYVATKKLSNQEAEKECLIGSVVGHLDIMLQGASSSTVSSEAAEHWQKIKSLEAIVQTLCAPSSEIYVVDTKRVQGFVQKTNSLSAELRASLQEALKKQRKSKSEEEYTTV